MRRTMAGVVVAVALIAGCGGGSDSPDSGGGGANLPGQSAGDDQYVDPFQKAPCLSKREVQQKISRIASQVQTPERKQREIRAVRQRAC